MTGFLLGPGAIDAIIALVVVEGLAMLALRVFGRGTSVPPFAANLLSGAFLLLALRGALGGDSPATIGICLSAALIAHVADQLGRWDRSARSSPMRATLTLRVSKALARGALRPRTDESSNR
jgi:hypothetical protein